MMPLSMARTGETITVARLHGEGPVKRRIMDMGITKGVDLRAEGGPPGGPHGAECPGV